MTQIYLKVWLRSKNYENLRTGGVIGVDTECDDVVRTVYTVVVVEVELIVVDCDLPLKFYSSKVLTVVVVEWGPEGAEWLNILS